MSPFLASAGGVVCSGRAAALATGYSAGMSEPSPPPVDRADIERASASLLTTVGAVARELNAGHANLPAVELDSSLARDFALDSLSRVELAARVERLFDISLAERAVFEAETPRDLLRAVMKARAGQPLTVRAAVIDSPPAATVGVPGNAATLAEMLAWHVQAHAQRPHIQFYDDYTDGEILTYADLWSGARAVAAALQYRGLLPGEAVALMLPTSKAYFFAFYGVVLAGGVPVPIYPPVRRQQLEDHLRRQSRILANCRAVMLITNHEALAVARLLTAAVDSLRHVFDAAELQSSPQAFETVVRRAEDTAFLQYTSGSTGDPKGVILSHANLLANVRADGLGMAVSPDDVFVSWLPLYHDMGLIGAWLGSLYHAVRLVVMPPLTFLARPERWLWAIHRYGGTLSAAPNFAYELCLKRVSDGALEGLDLSRWRIAANGAEAISATTLDAFCARFERYGFRHNSMFPVYGLAECSVGLTFSPLERGPLIEVVDRAALARDGIARLAAADAAPSDTLRVVGCGLPLPRHEIRVVDAAGRELPERHEGRLQFRGPSATSGYFGRPEASAELIRDGWLESGDRAYIAGGELFLTGRSKDIIIRAGRNIYPPELEDAIGDLDGIRKGHVAIFGSVDPDAGTERVVVLAETRKRDAQAREALRVRINELATDLIDAPPDDIVFAPPNTVLRTSSGKIRRSACRELYERGAVERRERGFGIQVLHLALAACVPQLRRASRALGAWLYAVTSWLLFGSLALVVWLLAWAPLPRRLLWRTARLGARAAAWLTATPLQIEGRDTLPPEGQPAIVVVNHQSYLDGMVMLAALPRPPRFLVKAELGRSRLLARPLGRLGALFTERFDAATGVAVVDDATTALEHGALLVIFPEGTFKRMPGVLPFHMGAFTVAADSATPLIPAALNGTRSILRAGSWFPRRGTIAVNFGAALTPAGNGWSAALQLRDEARRYIIDHCGEPDLAHESNVVDL